MIVNYVDYVINAPPFFTFVCIQERSLMWFLIWQKLERLLFLGQSLLSKVFQTLYEFYLSWGLPVYTMFVNALPFLKVIVMSET